MCIRDSCRAGAFLIISGKSPILAQYDRRRGGCNVISQVGPGIGIACVNELSKLLPQLLPINYQNKQKPPKGRQSLAALSFYSNMYSCLLYTSDAADDLTRVDL